MLKKLLFASLICLALFSYKKKEPKHEFMADKKSFWIENAALITSHHNDLEPADRALNIQEQVITDMMQSEFHILGKEHQTMPSGIQYSKVSAAFIDNGDTLVKVRHMKHTNGSEIIYDIKNDSKWESGRTIYISRAGNLTDCKIY